MKVLLLQARYSDDPALGEEVSSFARACGLDIDAFRCHDLLTGPPDLEVLSTTDVLMIGGSGDFYLSQGDLPRLEETLVFLRQVVDRGHPTFASCFGYQCMVLALGGELTYDPPAMEVGTFDLRLTDHGRQDELFGALPPVFSAQLGHKDRALQPAAGTINLARSELCALQALRVPGKPIWATQFHPELDREANHGRFKRYLDGYSTELPPQELERVHLRFKESTEASRLLPHFLRLVEAL